MALLITWGVWITIIAFSLEILILLIKDNELENWLEQTPFAQKDRDDAFTTVEAQAKALDAALYAQWGIGEPPQPQKPQEASAKNIPQFSDASLSLM